MDSTTREASFNGPPTLSTVRVGETVTVRCLADGPCTTRLRELGMDRGRRVRVLCVGDPLMCQLEDARIGLGRQLAGCILIDH